VSTPHKKILVFLALTLAFSSIFYYMIASAGKLESGPTFGLMWSPGLAAIITQLGFHRTLRGLGWKPGRAKSLLLAYVLPIGYGLITYGIIWLTGLGSLDSRELAAEASAHLAPRVSSPVALVLIYLVFAATLGTLQSLLPALGEEIGWRGLLVPELSKVNSFAGTALITGAIWALWHYPVVLLADYRNQGAPVWFGLICFTVMVLGASFVFAWMRLRSGSLWVAALLHANHNFFIQNVYSQLTRWNALTPYFSGEFGVILAAVSIIMAYVFWQRRHDVEFGPAPDRSDHAS
jgi:membrane protease YdiL (CAAX protease family)